MEHEADYESSKVDVPPEAVQYRALSVMAVVTTVLGVSSILVALSIKLWFLAVLALLLGLVTLGILRAHPEKTGRRGVVIAMMLACFFGSLGAARAYSRQTWLRNTARPFADRWVELVRTHDLYTAYQLHVPRPLRIERARTLEEYFVESPGARTAVDAFFGREAISVLVKHGHEATVEFVGFVGHVPEPNFDLITFQYRITYREDGHQRTKDLYVDMVREISAVDGINDWYAGRTT